MPIQDMMPSKDMMPNPSADPAAAALVWQLGAVLMATVAFYVQEFPKGWLASNLGWCGFLTFHN